MDYNDKIGEYEAHLREAERALENACRAICSIQGEEVSSAYSNIAHNVLPKVQDAIRGTYRLYK